MNPPARQGKLDTFEKAVRTLGAVLDTSSDGIVVTNPEHEVEEVNESFCQLFGVHRDDVVGSCLSKWLERLDSGALDRWVALVDRARARGEHQEIDFVQSSGGEVRYLNVRVSVMMQPNADENDRVVSVWRDRTEQELRKFQVIADTANYGMAIADLAGTILYVNPAFSGAHGYSTDELLGENLAILHNDDQMAALVEKNAILQRDGEYGPEEVWHTRKDGSTFPMLVNGVTILDDHGMPFYNAVTAIDISDRMASDKALRISERQQAAVAALGRQALASGDLESLLESAVRLIMETLDVSHCCVAELAADGAEFQLRSGVGWKAGASDGGIIEAEPEWQGGLALREGKAIVVEDVEKERRFDEPALFRDHHIVSSVTIPVRGWGRPFGVLAACEVRPRVFDEDDVNCLEGIANVLAHAIERKQAEDALATSRERLRNLAARLHAVREEERTLIAREIHDQLGQALTGLKMDLSWIMTRLPDDAVILDRANSMLSLLDTTVNSVRSISAQLRPPILDDLGLEAAIEWQAHEFARQAQIECHLDLQIGDRAVGGDRATAAFRILQEALTNVARHSDAKNAWIEIGVGGGELILSVSDDGRGVGDATLSSARSIGLIGMRERAGALGGRVEVRRRSEGGTCVRLELPLDQRLVGDS